jgi:hypothetical protein
MPTPEARAQGVPAALQRLELAAPRLLGLLLDGDLLTLLLDDALRAGVGDVRYGEGQCGWAATVGAGHQLGRVGSSLIGSPQGHQDDLGVLVQGW